MASIGLRALYSIHDTIIVKAKINDRDKLLNACVSKIITLAIQKISYLLDFEPKGQWRSVTTWRLRSSLHWWKHVQRYAFKLSNKAFYCHLTCELACNNKFRKRASKNLILEQFIKLFAYNTSYNRYSNFLLHHSPLLLQDSPGNISTRIQQSYLQLLVCNLADCFSSKTSL